MKQLDLFKDMVMEVKKLSKPHKQKKNSTLSKNEYDLLEFKRILNQSPPKSLLKRNQEFGNNYIPLQVIEQMLLAIYDHYEEVMPFPPTIVEGQILTVMNIIVHHPITKQKLTYSGLSCVPLISADSENQKYNHKNIPGGKGFALINAAKGIGQLFRADHDDYSNVMKPYFEKKIKVDTDSPQSNLKRRIMKMIDSSKNVTSLEKRLDDVKKLKDKEVVEAYAEKLKQLRK